MLKEIYGIEYAIAITLPECTILKDYSFICI